MSLNWIDPNEYSFNSFLLLERFQIRLMMDSCGWRNDSEKWKREMGIALKANPVVAWYLAHRCPECSRQIDELVSNAPEINDADLSDTELNDSAGCQGLANSSDTVVNEQERIRKAEIYALLSVEDFVIHTTPKAMATNCDYIRGWNKERLFELADLSGKTVLDVGAGSGRLTFAAAEKAKWVYASEPVGTLREFIRDKACENNITNIRVLDGLVTELPFPDNTFDIVMSGHVLGDEWEKENAEITRVCKNGGWLLNCPGDSEGNMCSSPELVALGWEEIHYIGSYGKDVYIHRKLVEK